MHDDDGLQMQILTKCSATSPASKLSRAAGRHHSCLPHLSAVTLCFRPHPQSSEAPPDNSFGLSELAVVRHTCTEWFCLKKTRALSTLSLTALHGPFLIAKPWKSIQKSSEVTQCQIRNQLFSFSRRPNRWKLILPSWTHLLAQKWKILLLTLRMRVEHMECAFCESSSQKKPDRAIIPSQSLCRISKVAFDPSNSSYVLKKPTNSEDLTNYTPVHQNKRTTNSTHSRSNTLS